MVCLLYTSGMLIPDIDMGVYQKADGGIGAVSYTHLPLCMVAMQKTGNLNGKFVFLIVPFFHNSLQNISFK